MPPDDDQVREAMAVLRVQPGASWAEVRIAYRTSIRRVHPDVNDDHRDATHRTIELNRALTILERVTEGGRRPLPVPEPVAPAPMPAARSPQAPVILRAPEGDVFVQLLDAAYEIGDVTYLDPEAGLIRVQLGSSAEALLQIDVDTRADPPRAAFTLDSHGDTDPPSLRSLVDEIARHLGAASPDDTGRRTGADE